MKSIIDADKAVERRLSAGEARDNSLEWIRRELSPLPASHALSRAYFKDLRAAEMMAWQVSGGDYLISNAKRGAETGYHTFAD
jgi:hypothetical protein